MAILRLLRGAAADFRDHGCASLAASLAFFSLLSFFPVIFVVLYAMSAVLRQPVGHEMMLNFLNAFLPALGPDLAEEIKRVAGIDAVRWVIVVTAIWFGMQVFYEMDYVVNVVFGTPRKRHPLLSAALSAALVALVGILLVLSYLVTQVLGFIVYYAPRMGKLDLAAVDCLSISSFVSASLRSRAHRRSGTLSLSPSTTAPVASCLGRWSDSGDSLGNGETSIQQLCDDRRNL